MFHYGVVLILSPKMVYIKSKIVELDLGSPDKKIHHGVFINDELVPTPPTPGITQVVKPPN